MGLRPEIHAVNESPVTGSGERYRLAVVTIALAGPRPPEAAVDLRPALYRSAAAAELEAQEEFQLVAGGAGIRQVWVLRQSPDGELTPVSVRTWPHLDRFDGKDG